MSSTGRTRIRVRHHAANGIVTQTREVEDGAPQRGAASAWIERGQFACYLTVAQMIAAPEESPAFRRALRGTLVAALYLDRHLAADTSPDDAPERHHAMRLLDDIRDRYNPAATWVGFVLELWTPRRDLRHAMER